jgi:hypothetical protein
MVTVDFPTTPCAEKRLEKAVQAPPGTIRTAFRANPFFRASVPGHQSLEIGILLLQIFPYVVVWSLLRGWLFNVNGAPEV